MNKPTEAITAQQNEILPPASDPRLIEGIGDMGLQASVHELEPQQGNYEAYFSSLADKTEKIHATAKGLQRTPYGAALSDKLAAVQSTTPITYDEFTSSFPLVKPAQVGEDPLQFVIGETDKLEKAYSGGTTGKPKEFFFPEDELVVDLPYDLIGPLLEAEKPAFLHGDWHSMDFVVMGKSLQHKRPDIDVIPYDHVGTAIEKIKDKDAVMLEVGVMSYKIFHYYMKRTLDSDPALREAMREKQWVIEFNSEPVSVAQLEEWSNDIEEYFGKAPMIHVTYTQNDTGLIGTYMYKKGDTQADLQYGIVPDRIVEVLDDGGELVIGKKGDIVISTLREEGSILMRYVSGDVGKLSVDENGRTYISEIERKSDSGTVSLWGLKVSVGEIYEKLQSQLSFPVQMETIQAEQDETGMNMGLDFNFYSQELEQHPELAEEIKEKLDKALNEIHSYDLHSYLDLEDENSPNLYVNVRYAPKAPESLQKGWRLVKPQRGVSEKAE